MVNILKTLVEVLAILKHKIKRAKNPQNQENIKKGINVTTALIRVAENGNMKEIDERSTGYNISLACPKNYRVRLKRTFGLGITQIQIVRPNNKPVCTI